MQQNNMGGYPPAMQKEKLGAILVLMAIRVIAGALLGTLTGLSMVVQPLAGGYGALTMIAGFLCVPVAILLFMRKPAFPWLFLIMIAMNAVGGIVIASHPAMKLAAMFLPVQKIFLVLVIIMDVLFVIYLIRAKKVAAVFGANLFRPAGAAPRPAYAQPYRQQQPAYTAAQQPDVQGEPAQEPQPEYAQPAYHAQAAQQPYQPYAQQQPYYQSQSYRQNPRQMSRGAFVGLCIGISAAAVLVISLLMNNYFSKKYSNPLSGLGSLFDSGSLFGSDEEDYGLSGLFGSGKSDSGLSGLFGSGKSDSGLSGLFGSDKDNSGLFGLFGGDEEDEKSGKQDLWGYVDNEIDRSVKNSLRSMLQPGGSVELTELEVKTEGDNLVMNCYLPQEFYSKGLDLYSDANEQNRKELAAVLKDDIREKTDVRDARIIFVYYDEDGGYIAEYYY